MEYDILGKILDEKGEHKSLEVESLSQILKELNITNHSYSIEEIANKEIEIGSVPKLLKEYFLEIGKVEKRDDEYDDDLLEDSSGCYIKELKDIYILTDEKLKKNYGDMAKNEVDDYLVFGFEMIDGEEFAIKLRDIDKENPNIFSSEELDGISKEEGKVFGVLESAKTLKEYFSLIALSAYEA